MVAPFPLVKRAATKQPCAYAGASIVNLAFACLSAYPCLAVLLGERDTPVVRGEFLSLESKP